MGALNKAIHAFELTVNCWVFTHSQGCKVRGPALDLAALTVTQVAFNQAAFRLNHKVQALLAIAFDQHGPVRVVSS